MAGSRRDFPAPGQHQPRTGAAPSERHRNRNNLTPPGKIKHIVC
ncbi:hypothetical protein DA2_2684 [Desulfovibrio sp. A2]|nr:hypothetical protein DA2_2684 [Desulfovibrio sp. A2]